MAGPAYRIVTQRLVLRCWQPLDATSLKTAIDDSLAHLQPWLPWSAAEPTTLDDKVAKLRQMRGAFDLDQDLAYGVFDPAESTVLGAAGLHLLSEEDTREIGYWVHVDKIRAGFGTEIAAALTKVGFEVHDLRRIDIYCARENIASAAIPRKLGYVHEGTLRERIVQPGGPPSDKMVWSLLDREYPSSPSARVAIEAFDAVGKRILRS